MTLKQRIKKAERAKKRADWDFEDDNYSRHDWVFEVGNRDTQLGYCDWVIHKLEAEIESGN